jgi:hypothetical protein
MSYETRTLHRPLLLVCPWCSSSNSQQQTHAHGSSSSSSGGSSSSGSSSMGSGTGANAAGAQDSKEGAFELRRLTQSVVACLTCGARAHAMVKTRPYLRGNFERGYGSRGAGSSDSAAGGRSGGSSGSSGSSNGSIGGMVQLAVGQLGRSLATDVENEHIVLVSRMRILCW